MKKIIQTAFILFISITLFSCKKNDAIKDVENSIIKLEQFNNKFDELYNDGQISRDTIADAGNSEYDQLKKIASEYYEIMNKINSEVEEEKEKEKDNYIKGYEKALEDKKEKINTVTAEFNENLSKI